MLSEGIVLMVAGMGTVFVFLWLMVLVMGGTAWFFQRFAHVFADEQPAESHLAVIAQDNYVEIAVAVAAIRHYQGK